MNLKIVGSRHILNRNTSMNQERILNLVTTVVKWHLQHFGEEAADKTLSKIVEMGVVSRLSN